MKPAEKGSDKSINKVLSLKQLYFISVGGQGPFISLIAFGTPMIAIAGLLSPLSMIIATIIVLANGLVINSLSRRFARGGGYYTYGLYGLTKRLGFETGWMYIFYGLNYGGSLILGGAYVFSLITGIKPFYSLLIILVTLSAVFLSGVKISATYAEIFAGAEIVVLVFLAFFLFYMSGFKLYNPFHLSSLDLSKVWLGALYGLGIPTGYGAIAPLAEESKEARKDIGLAAILSILTGGLLATFFFYSIADLNFTGNLTQFLLSNFGLWIGVLLAIVAISDGVLGGISFLLAVSRVIYNISKDGFIHSIFSKIHVNRPLIAELTATIAMILLLVPTSYWIGITNGLIIIPALAGLFNLFVHEAANFSLFRISLVRKSVKRVLESILSIIAIIISGYLLISSIIGVNKYVILGFFGWMIVGFFYLEILDISRNAKEE